MHFHLLPFQKKAVHLIGLCQILWWIIPQSNNTVISMPRITISPIEPIYTAGKKPSRYHRWRRHPISLWTPMSCINFSFSCNPVSSEFCELPLYPVSAAVFLTMNSFFNNLGIQLHFMGVSCTQNYHTLYKKVQIWQCKYSQTHLS